MKKVLTEKQKHKLRSRNYKTRLRDAVEGGDFEDVVKSLMLLAIKHNSDEDFKASPRTWMELLQVLHKYKVEFGTGGDDIGEVLRVINGADIFSADRDDEE